MPASTVLDAPLENSPDPDEYIRAAMRWHFDPETGSPFWLERARRLPFEPREEVTTHDDLRMFPDVADELRDVPVRDLVPRGYGPHPDVVGVYDSGGTTGSPKRVPLLRDWCDAVVAWSNATLDEHGFPRGVDWLGITPTGPHIVGEFFRRSASSRGGLGFAVDLDPRWVKRLIADGRRDMADAYTDHIVEQAETVLRSQAIGVMTITPPLLERLARRQDLVDLVNEKVQAIRWGGTQMDPDTADLFRNEVFPGVTLYGNYGSTMVVGFGAQRPGDERCVFDPPAPAVTYSVRDPQSGVPVREGERGQVVKNHVSRSFLLPNIAERDMATRIAARPGSVGDAVADVTPIARVGDTDTIEGVY